MKKSQKNLKALQYSNAENTGKILKNWNDGMLEYWRKQFFVYHSIIPFFFASLTSVISVTSVAKQFPLFSY
jgi:hypothetical protein